MAKILVHLKLSHCDTFTEIVNLNRVWTNRNNPWGKWALMYSDDKYNYNTLFYTSEYDVAYSAQKKLVEAYKSGEKSIDL